MRNKFNFDEIIARLQQVKNDLPLVLANATKNYFLQAFSRAAWNGVSWKPVQRQSIQGGSSRNQSAPLVQSGRLRRAVASSLKTANFNLIKFVVDVPYAAIQNFGGTIRREAHTKVLHFSEGGGFAKSKSAKQRKAASYSQRVQISGYDIHIPGRQFIGDAPELRVIQRGIVKKYIGGIFK